MHERCRQVCSQRRKYAGHHHVTPFISSVFRNALACSATAPHTQTHTPFGALHLPHLAVAKYTRVIPPNSLMFPIRYTRISPRIAILAKQANSFFPLTGLLPHIPPHPFPPPTPPFTRFPHRFTQIIFFSLHSALSLLSVSLQRRVPKSRIVNRVGKQIFAIWQTATHYILVHSAIEHFIHK